MDYSKAEYDLTGRGVLLGAQMLFVAFGALILVPLLTGLDPNVALFTAGGGTLIFQLVTRGRVPVFLASSFAFISPIIHGVQTWGVPGTLCGLAVAGLVYLLISFAICVRGSDFVLRLLPPVVTGPVIMIIGLILAPVAVNMAIGKTGDGAKVLVPQNPALLVAALSLMTTILVTTLGRGWLRLIPILCGITSGYVLSVALGLTDFAPARAAPWLAIPAFTLPKWNGQAIVFILPVAIAPAIEHIGDVIAIGSVTGRNYLKDPGVHRTMLGDGLATAFASLLGGPPNTTYSEVSGAVALTRIFNPAVMTWAAVIAILLAFVGKIGALLQTIPTPVMGGIMTLLFGAITVVGLNSLVKAQEDLMAPRNFIIVAVTLVVGIGKMVISVRGFSMGGIGLASIVGVVLNLVLPKRQPPG